VHQPSSRRRRLVALAALLVVLLGTGIGLGVAILTRPTPAEIAAERAAERAAAAARARARLLRHEVALARGAESLVDVALPTHLGAPAPPTPRPLFRRPLPPHLVLGFAPYWEIAGLLPADYADTSLIAYYGLTLRGDGTVSETDRGWQDLHSGLFATLRANARAASDGVLLTVDTADPTVIAQALAHPALSAVHLVAAVAPLLRADALTGVDLDIEGRAGTEAAAFVRFVQVFTHRLALAVPGAEVVLDTYPQSAGESAGFFDIARLAPLVSKLFVMGYDMYDPAVASANAPLLSPTLGLNDTQTVMQYRAVVPAGKLILGVPFYGYDFTTLAKVPGAPSITTDPVAVDYSAIVAAARPARWDPSSLTPFTDFLRAGQHHQTWYDNPVSVALKTALAARAGLAGVGVWALGAEGGATAMLGALDGTRPPVKLAPASAAAHG
jgi:hypothetical protein